MKTFSFSGEVEWESLMEGVTAEFLQGIISFVCKSAEHNRDLAICQVA